MELFEARHGVRLPEDVRDYLGGADGMQEGANVDQDSAGFSFWPLKRWSRADDELRGQGSQAVDVVGFYAFADYLGWSWAYAVGLDPVRLDYGNVIVIGTETGMPRTLATSFREFVELYVRDDPRLYGSR
jgi:hypothetical protein